MKIEQTQITKLLLSELMGEPHMLDPVTVILEDLEPRRGKIIIECYGKSWSAYWGGMGDRSIAQFFADCSTGYLIGNLDPQLRSWSFNGKALVDKVKKAVISARRGRDFTADEAREYFDEADQLKDASSIDYLAGAHYELMQAVFGDEWWHEADRSDKPNPDYLYLQRIVLAVQAGLRKAGLAQGEVAA